MNATRARLVESRREAAESETDHGYGFGVCEYRKCRKRFPLQRSWQRFDTPNCRALEWQEVTRAARKVYLRAHAPRK